mgnify:CR=1 FL=1
MGHYKSNLRDIEFNLFEVFGRDEVLGQGPYEAVDADTAREMLKEYARLAENELAESFADADRNPPVFDPETSSGRLMLGMLGTLAEYERELITERVNAGIAAAKSNGTRFGRPPVDPEVVDRKLAIVAEERAKGRSAEDAASMVGWSRATLYRHLQGAKRRQSALPA